MPNKIWHNILIRMNLNVAKIIKLLLTQLPLWIPNLAKSFKLIRTLDSGSSLSFGIGCIKETGKGDDKINGDTGNDKVEGNQGNDQIEGGEGDDSLKGGKENDEIQGDIGNDKLDGGEGADEMEGGEGTDSFICDNFDNVMDFDSQEGDTISGQCTFEDESAVNNKENTPP